MRMIFRIARKELEVLFYSPIAWFILLIFTVQTALSFTDVYVSLIPRRSPAMSFQIFGKALWGEVQTYLYYYIPLLTMGVISRELSSGSIKLLYSSPVKNRDIVLGKYLAMVTYVFAMFTILLVYVVICGCTIKDFEWTSTLVGWFGLFMLACTYMAIGVFVSSLTSYQFVAAIGTFVVFMLLGSLWNLGQEYDVIRDITYWTCILGRASTFVNGLVCSEDLLYFPLVTILFLSLCIIRLNAIRQKEPKRKTLGKYMGVVAIICFCGYLSSRPTLKVYADTTRMKMNSILPKSQEVVAQLDGDLEITAYVNIFASYQAYRFPRFVLFNQELFEEFVRFKPDTKLKVVYYYDTITPQDDPFAAERLRKELEKHKTDLHGLMQKYCINYRLDTNRVLSPAEIRAKVDLTGERTFVYECKLNGGRHSWLHTITDRVTVYPRESEITTALSRLIEESPKIGYVTGHGVRTVDGLDKYGYYTFLAAKQHQNSVVNMGFDVVNVSLARRVPDDITVLMIADQRTPFSAEEEEHLREYIERGGNLFVLGEPKRQEVMNPWLNKYLGVELTDGTLVQYRDKDLNPDELRAPLTAEASRVSPFFVAKFVSLPTATGIERVADRGFSFVPLAQSDTLAEEVKIRENRSYRVWNELESLDYAVSPLEYHPEAGEEAKTYTTMAAMSRMINGKEQRVVIVGDADCMANGSGGLSSNTLNASIPMGTFHYLSNACRPIYMPIEIPDLDRVDDKVYMSFAGWGVMRIVLVWGLPILLAGSGIFIYIRRRSR